MRLEFDGPFCTLLLRSDVEKRSTRETSSEGILGAEGLVTRSSSKAVTLLPTLSRNSLGEKKG